MIKASKEVAILFPEVKSFSFGDLAITEIDESETKPKPSLIIKWKQKPNPIKKKTSCFSKFQVEHRWRVKSNS